MIDRGGCDEGGCEVASDTCAARRTTGPPQGEDGVESQRHAEDRDVAMHSLEEEQRTHGQITLSVVHSTSTGMIEETIQAKARVG